MVGDTGSELQIARVAEGVDVVTFSRPERLNGVVPSRFNTPSTD